MSANTGFDLFKISKSQEAVGICRPTIQQYIRRGLPCYRCGKFNFVSRSELNDFIKGKGSAMPPPPRAAAKNRSASGRFASI